MISLIIKLKHTFMSMRQCSLLAWLYNWGIHLLVWLRMNPMALNILLKYTIISMTMECTLCCFDFNTEYDYIVYVQCGCDYYAKVYI